MKNSSATHFNGCGFSADIPSTNYVLNQQFACVVYGLLFIPTVLLNGISIFTFFKCSQLREKVSYFTILMQSAVDLITGVITLPILTAHVLLKDVIRIENGVICWLNITLAYFPITLSVFTLCLLSFERYMGVVHPLIHHAQVTKKRIMISECCAALLMLIFFVIKAILNNSDEFNKTVFFVDEIIPVLFLIYVYTRIFITARKSLSLGDRLRDTPAQGPIEEMKRKRRFLRDLKLAKSCFLVTCIFCLCFLPSMVPLPEIHYLDDETIEMLSSWAIALVVLNSSLNPIVFFWSQPMLRKEAIKVLKICCS